MKAINQCDSLVRMQFSESKSKSIKQLTFIFTIELVKAKNMITKND